MPPLLCPSHEMLDFSKEKSGDELRQILYALGEITGLVNSGEVDFLITDFLKSFVGGEDFCWSQPEPSSTLLREIYNKYIQFFMNQHEGIIEIDLNGIESDQLHPIIKGNEKTPIIELWANEIQKILIKHDMHINEKFFIGIPCKKAFSGEKIGEYENPENLRCFPLIGPNNLNELEDAYDWLVPSDLHQINISPDMVRKNIHLLGGICEDPQRDSHCKVSFTEYTWNFSINNNPVPEKYLHQLVVGLKKPINVIKYTLSTGSIPQKSLRFNMK